MHDLVTLQELNERKAMAAISAEVNGPAKAPYRLGRHYVWESGDTLLFSLEPRLEHKTTPVLVIDFAGERSSGRRDGSIRQVFTVQVQTGMHRLKTLPTQNRKQLKSTAAKLGIRGLDPILDGCYGKETNED